MTADPCAVGRRRGYAHFYAWDDPKFFSVDIYTCKASSADAAVRFTEKWFAATEIVHKGVLTVLAEAFALDAREAQRLTDGLLDGAGDRRFSVHLVESDDAAALLSLQVAGDVFLESFGNTPGCCAGSTRRCSRR